MQEQLPSKYLHHKAVTNGTVKIQIKIEPHTLEMDIPLEWEINKLKCLICTQIPKLEFGMVRLEHDGKELTGMMTFDKVLAMDRDQECMARHSFVIRFTRKENDPKQFENYYAQKMVPFLSTMRHSPFQPVLNPKYSALQSQFHRMKDLADPNTRIQHFQSLFNLRALIEANRNRADPPANNEGAQVENVEGIGVLGPRPAGNGNIFERGAFWIFKLLQVLLLWQLIQLVYNHISTAHIFILIGIILAYFCIEHFQKAKNQGNQAPGVNDANQMPRQAGQPQNHKQAANQTHNLTTNESERVQQQGLKQVQIEINRNGLPVWLLKGIKLTCLLGEVLVSFTMSLFPNWTIQLHNNMLREKFTSIDRKLEQWQHPSQLKELQQSQKQIQSEQDQRDNSRQQHLTREEPIQQE